MVLIERAKAILEEIQSAGVRAVCCRLVVNGWLSSMAKNCTDKVRKQLVYARMDAKPRFSVVTPGQRSNLYCCPMSPDRSTSTARIQP